MQKFPPEEVQKRYQALPERLKDFLFADETADFIESLGQKHSLLLDKTGALAEEVGYFALGLVPPRQFPIRLKEVTGLADEKIAEIIKELNATIFEPVRAELMQLHNAEESGMYAPPQELHTASFSTTKSGGEAITPQQSPTIPQAPRFATQRPDTTSSTPIHLQTPVVMNDPYHEAVE